MNKSESITNLAVALNTVQSQLMPAKMNATAHHGKYADLQSVINACKDLLVANGLSFVQMASTPSVEYWPSVGLTTMLMHTSGEWISDTMTLPVDSGRNTGQEAGKAITYARRYALASMLGIVADEDTDGNYGNKKKGAKQQPQRQQTSNNRNGVNGSTRQKKGLDPSQHKPSEQQMKALHAAGTAVYGDDWDLRRAELVEYVTDKRTASSKHITAEEWKTLIDGINKKANQVQS